MYVYTYIYTHICLCVFSFFTHLVSLKQLRGGRVASVGRGEGLRARYSLVLLQDSGGLPCM